MRDAGLLVVLKLGAVDVIHTRGGAAVERQFGIAQTPLAVAILHGLGRMHGEERLAAFGLRVGEAVGLVNDGRACMMQKLPPGLQRAIAAVADVRCDHRHQQHRARNQHPPQSFYRQSHRRPSPQSSHPFVSARHLIFCTTVRATFSHKSDFLQSHYGRPALPQPLVSELPPCVAARGAGGRVAPVCPYRQRRPAEQPVRPRRRRERVPHRLDRVADLPAHLRQR